MYDQHVVLIVDDAAPVMEEPNNVDIRFFGNWGIPPAAPKVDKRGCLLILSLEEEDLEPKSVGPIIFE